MLRTILRNIQYALLVASFLLFMMGVERMQSFDHRMSPLSSPSSSSSYWSPSSHHHNMISIHHHRHHAASSDSSSLDETSSNDNYNTNNLYSSFRVPNTQHQISFSNEFRIGLFRFVLPRLERLNNDETDTTTSENQKHDHNNKNKKNLRPSAWKVPMEKRTKPEATLAFLLNTTEACLSKSMIASALVFAESVRNSPNSSLFQLYAYHGQHNTTSETRCQSWLQSAGYELILPSSYPEGESSSCWNDTDRLLLQAHHVNAEMAIPIQLPSLLMKGTNSSSTTSTTESPPTSNNGDTKTSFLRTLRPQGRQASSLEGSIHQNCIKHHNSFRNQSTAESLPAWQYSPCDSFGICPVPQSSKGETAVAAGVSLATFQNCSKPWKCSRTHCLQQQPSICRQQLEQWLRHRDKLRERLSTNANNVKLAL